MLATTRVGVPDHCIHIAIEDCQLVHNVAHHLVLRAKQYNKMMFLTVASYLATKSCQWIVTASRKLTLYGGRLSGEQVATSLISWLARLPNMSGVRPAALGFC